MLVRMLYVKLKLRRVELLMDLHLTASYMGSHSITCHGATRHKLTHRALYLARQAGTWFTYPGGMEGWVDP